jgi:hypothetical protein
VEVAIILTAEITTVIMISKKQGWLNVLEFFNSLKLYVAFFGPGSCRQLALERPGIIWT